MKRGLALFSIPVLVALSITALMSSTAQAEGEFWLNGQTFASAKVAEKALVGSIGETELTIPPTVQLFCANGEFTGTAFQGGTLTVQLLMNSCSILESELCTVAEDEEGEIEEHLLITAEGELMLHEGKHFLLLSGPKGKSEILSVFYFLGPFCPLPETLEVVGSQVIYLPTALETKKGQTIETMEPGEQASLFPEDGIYFGAEEAKLAGGTTGSLELQSGEDWSFAEASGLPEVIPVTINNTGKGKGHVDCEVNGKETDKPCKTGYPEGTELKLIGVEDVGSEFSTFENGTGNAKGCEATCEFTLTEETEVDAVFVPAPKIGLTVHNIGAGSGQVSCEVNEGEKTDKPCASEYYKNTKLKLIGEPNATSEFAGFEGGTGNAKGCAATCVFTLTEATLVDAVFNPLPEFLLEGKTFTEAEIAEEAIEGSVGKGELSATTGEVKPACANGNLSGSVIKGGTAQVHVLYNACVVKGYEEPCKVYEGLGEAGDPETLFGEGHLLTSGNGKLLLHEGKHHLLVEGSGEGQQLASFYIYGASCSLDEGLEPLHLLLAGSTVLYLPDALTSKVEHGLETIAPATLESLFAEDGLTLNGQAASLAGGTTAAAHLSSGEKWSAEASEFLLKGKTFTEAEVTEKAIEGSVGEMEVSAVAGEITTSCVNGNLSGSVIKGGTAKVHTLSNECIVKGAEETCSAYESLGKEGDPETLIGKGHILATGNGKLLEHEKSSDHYLLLEGLGKEKEVASFYVYGASCAYNDGEEPLHLVLTGSTVLSLPGVLESKAEHTLETIAPATLESLFPADDLSLNGEEAHLAGGTAAAVHLVSKESWSAQ